MQDIYKNMVAGTAAQKKRLAILIDPDKPAHLPQILAAVEGLHISYFFVGGSLVSVPHIADVVAKIKQATDIPVVIFPGSPAQITPNADGILLLSLISGRNAELLIGSHVVAAPMLKQSGLEILPTGYMLIDGGKPTTVSYISNTQPIPANKPEIAACTAMAGEMLGLKIIYLDAGSGAQNHVSVAMIEAVRQQVSLPIIVGGGITSPAIAQELYRAGADILVVGNVLEKSPELLQQFSDVLKAFL